MKTLLATLAPCVLLAVAAVAASTGARQDAPPAPEAAPVGHKVSGKVLYDGPRPEAKPLSIAAEQAKGCCADGSSVDATDPALVVDDKNGLKNAVVEIDVKDAKLVVPKEAIVVDQRKCVFDPHVVVVPAGATVRFLNSDGVAHNVRAQSLKNDSFNKTMAPGGKDEVVFANADKVKINCDYHPWMSNWVYVTDKPFHALTAADGSFSVEGVPPGAWKVKVWHETLGRGEGEVVVGADGKVAALELKLAPKKKKA